MEIHRVAVERCGLGEGAVWDADERALLGRQGAERAEELRQRALAAKHADADGFEVA